MKISDVIELLKKSENQEASVFEVVVGVEDNSIYISFDDAESEIVEKETYGNRRN